MIGWRGKTERLKGGRRGGAGVRIKAALETWNNLELCQGRREQRATVLHPQPPHIIGSTMSKVLSAHNSLSNNSESLLDRGRGTSPHGKLKYTFISLENSFSSELER